MNNSFGDRKAHGGPAMATDRLNVVLTEFQVLRSEIDLKLKMVYQIYIIYFTALGFFYGYVVGNQKNDLILAVPFVALALFFRLIYDQLVMRKIGDYIKSHISEQQIPSIIGRDQPPLMQWQQYYDSYGPWKYYKWSYLMIFIFVSVGPGIWRNWVILSSCYTALPIWFQWLSLIFNLAAGVFMTLMIIFKKF